MYHNSINETDQTGCAPVVTEKEIDRIGIYAGLLATTEIGLGGILHAARIPLRGQFLSLNQIFILMRLSVESKDSSRFNSLIVSNIAALLKSLTPIGNKLTPMLAISMQGLLFNLGIFLFGHSFAGRVFGGCCASCWATIQPLLLYGIIFGNSGLKALFFGIKGLEQFFPRTQELLFYILATIILMKMLLVIVLAYLASSLSDKQVTSYITKISGFTMPAQQKGKISGAVRQICRPVFLLSVSLTALLLFFSEGNPASFLRHLLQPLAAGFLLFYLLRLLPVEKMIQRYEKNESIFGKALQIALQRIRSYTETTCETARKDRETQGPD